MEVGIVNGAGNSNHVHNYLHDDLKPFNGISYYRLKPTDYNGDFTFSEIKAVNISVNDEASL